MFSPIPLPAQRFLLPIILLLLVLFPCSASHQPPLRKVQARSPSHAADLFFQTFAKDHYSAAEVTEIEKYHKLARDAGLGSVPRSLIVEGENSVRGKFRWMTALIAPSASGYYHFCGASLIHEKYVLTAAHCVEGTDLTGGGMTVAIGRYQLNNVTEHGQVMNVKAVYQVRMGQEGAGQGSGRGDSGVLWLTFLRSPSLPLPHPQHPDYNPNTMLADVAILELPEAVTHPYIRTVPLVTDEVSETLRHGSIVTVSGWGALSSSSTPPSRRSLLSCDVPNPDFIGDGWCDKGVEYNSMGCGYDGGDCCPTTCTCTASTPGCYANCGSNGYDCKDPENGGARPTCQADSTVLGDGYCDSGEANSEICGWDGGDCCESSCSSSDLNDCGVNGYTCLDPVRTDNNVQVSIVHFIIILFLSNTHTHTHTYTHAVLRPWMSDRLEP